jgi:hypothetical protein
MIIDLPIRLIQKNNQKRYILFPKCKNTLECYFKNNIKKSFIVTYQSHYDLFFRKFVDKIYIDFTIYNNFEGNLNHIVINDFEKYFKKYNIKYTINNENIKYNTYCKFLIPIILSEILDFIKI